MCDDSALIIDISSWYVNNTRVHDQDSAYYYCSERLRGGYEGVVGGWECIEWPRRRRLALMEWFRVAEDFEETRISVLVIVTWLSDDCVMISTRLPHDCQIATRVRQERRTSRRRVELCVVWYFDRPFHVVDVVTNDRVFVIWINGPKILWVCESCRTNVMCLRLRCASDMVSFRRPMII